MVMMVVVVTQIIVVMVVMGRWFDKGSDDAGDDGDDRWRW